MKTLQILESRHPGVLPGSQQVSFLTIQHISALCKCKLDDDERGLLSQVLQAGGSSLLQASDREAKTLLCSHLLRGEFQELC